MKKSNLDRIHSNSITKMTAGCYMTGHFTYRIAHHIALDIVESVSEPQRIVLSPYHLKIADICLEMGDTSSKCQPCDVMKGSTCVDLPTSIKSIYVGSW